MDSLGVPVELGDSLTRRLHVLQSVHVFAPSRDRRRLAATVRAPYDVRHIHPVPFGTPAWGSQRGSVASRSPSPTRTRPVVASSARRTRSRRRTSPILATTTA